MEDRIRWRELDLDTFDWKHNALEEHPELDGIAWKDSLGRECRVVGVSALFPSEDLLVERSDGTNYTPNVDQVLAVVEKGSTYLPIENPDDLISDTVFEQFLEDGELTGSFHRSIDACPEQQRLLRSYAADEGDPDFERWVNENWPHDQK